MIDIKFLREHPDLVEEAAKNKNVSVNVSYILKIDKEYRELATVVQELQAKRNKFAKEKNIEEGKKLKVELEKKEKALDDVKAELEKELAKIPNIPSSDVKMGIDESENEVIKKYKEPTKLDFTPRDHVELGKLLDIIDIERATKVSGARFAYLKNEAVLLEFALVQFALETLTKEGFIPIIPPVLINQEVTKGLGYWNAPLDSKTGLTGNEDYYLVGEPKEGKNFYLVGTAEHAVVPMHKDETFHKKELPKRYVAFSSAFRREAGSYGKDTKGILRVHQFDKVEMVSFVSEEDDDREHDFLLSLEEKLFQSLEIPYQVVKMVTGDLGFPAGRKFDIEAWIPSQEKYREVTSVSTVTDFQARRLHIKYQDGGDKKFVHILNGTAFAIGRTLIAILENFQEEDGSVVIPHVLQKYVGFKKISPK